jgi:hypothetical protein
MYKYLDLFGKWREKDALNEDRVEMFYALAVFNGYLLFLVLVFMNKKVYQNNS